MGWATAGDILNDAAVELGLVSGDLADPFASRDANIVQLRRFLRALGRDLARKRAWSHLQKEYSFLTDMGEPSYDMPGDFLRHLDGTQWNRTQAMRMIGPATARGWQFLQATEASSVLYSMFRTKANKLVIHPPPAGALHLALEYISSSWVQPADEEAPTADSPSAADDVLHFDARLLVTGAKLYFLRAKGFDTTAAQRDYDAAYSQAAGADEPGAVLSLGRKGGEDQHTGPGVPDGGFGADGSFIGGLW
jgi:hypothetical protein